MKRISVLAVTVAALYMLYMLFVVLYSSRVMHSAITIPLTLAPERSIRPISAVPQFKPDASSIASWCSRMQREGDVIARSFDGGARSNFDAFFRLFFDLLGPHSDAPC